MKNPLPNCEKFLVGALKGNSDLMAKVGGRIYSGVPPKGAVYPCLIFSLYTHRASLARGRNETQLELPAYTIKALTKENDYGTAHKIAAGIDDALEEAGGEVTWEGRTVTVMGTRILGRIEYTDPDQTQDRINHVGANYRLFVC